jgi:hypothetical protein
MARMEGQKQPAATAAFRLEAFHADWAQLQEALAAAGVPAAELGAGGDAAAVLAGVRRRRWWCPGGVAWKRGVKGGLKGGGAVCPIEAGAACSREGH